MCSWLWQPQKVLGEDFQEQRAGRQGNVPWRAKDVGRVMTASATPDDAIFMFFEKTQVCVDCKFCLGWGRGSDITRSEQCMQKRVIIPRP